jgi:hypothetical protein
MKKFWDAYKYVILLLAIWRITLVVIEKYSYIVPLHTGYIGPGLWANHDGYFYLRIAEHGYYTLSEAFFPFYPIMIALWRMLFNIPYWIIGSCISLTSFVLGILLLHVNLSKENKRTAWWTIVYLVTFPTSFFFSAVYTEGLFFLLSILVYIASKRKLWMWAGLFGALASSTKLFGVLLLIYVVAEYILNKPKKLLLRDIIPIACIPLGLVSYMIYLYITKGDPLYFFHLQPVFGANRSGSTIILLPQVFWRYGKILFTAFLQPTPASYFITTVELVSTLFAYAVLWYGFLKKERWSLLIYGLATVTLPTMTGTLSSMPRYILSVFPLFIILGKIHNSLIQYSLLGIFITFQIILSAMFLRGWFVS